MPPSTFAQVAQYSYISDRRFTSPDQFMGYDFKPAMREVPGEDPTDIAVGTYSFGITRKNLYVEGPEIQGVYSLNEINTTEYGFILKTMNARDPTIQGHLKVVVDETGQVEGLIFKRSNHDPEVIYFLRMIPQEVDEAERHYFTNKGEEKIDHLDSLWTGIEIRPFLRIFNNMGGIQQRVLPSDSVSLRFYHVTTVEEKDNKVMALVKSRKGRKGRKDEQEEAATMLTASTSPIPVALPQPVPSTAVLAPTIAKTETGGLVDARKQLPLDSAEVARRDSVVLAMGGSVDSLGRAFDSLGRLVAVDTLTGVTDSSRLAAYPPVIVDSSAVAVDSSKLKITTQFFVDLNSFMRYDDGTSAMQHRTYLVNGAAERINPNARPGGDRYQWELNLHKQPAAYVYLDEKLNVNSIEIDGQKFYMRGQ